MPRVALSVPVVSSPCMLQSIQSLANNLQNICTISSKCSVFGFHAHIIIVIIIATMNRAGPGPASPLVLFCLSMLCISTFFILFSPTPFKLPSPNHRHNPSTHDDESNDENDDVPIRNRAEEEKEEQSSKTEEEEEGEVSVIDDECDLSDGRWVPDMRGSAYTNWSCPTIPVSKNCFLNGREDRDFLNWRWKPEKCEVPRFDPRLFLRIMRKKKFVFVGDSVARNHMESLLCLLSQEEAPKDKYRDSEDRFRTWYFPNHDFTLSVRWTRFMVADEERLNNGSGTGIHNLHLDKIDPNWSNNLHNTDYIVLSNAHWFFRKLYLYKSSKLIGCIYCDDDGVKAFNVDHGLRMAFRAAFEFLNECKECKDGMVTIVRTFSPAHFEGGGWDSGGGCNRTSPRLNEEVEVERLFEWSVRNAQVDEVIRAQKMNELHRRIKVLDVTRAMLMRPDGHPGLHWDNQWMKGYSDCVHWCMPGPVDAWSDLLLAVIRQKHKL